MRIVTGVLLICFLFTFEGCKKYPEDDTIGHLRTAKCRLTRYRWFGGGSCGTCPNPSRYPHTLSFSKKGRYYSDLNSHFWYSGNWKFDKKKANIILTDDSLHIDWIFIIRQLEDGDLRLEHDTFNLGYVKEKEI